MKDILIKTLDLPKLLESKPELFDFSKLDSHQKEELLRINYKLFVDRIKRVSTERDKMHFVIYGSNPKIRNLFTLTEKEILDADSSTYAKLINSNFKKYINKVQFLKLNRNDQLEIFIRHPEWVVKNIEKVPTLTSERLVSISRYKPKFIDKYVTDFSVLSTTTPFWLYMIKYDRKYINIFFNNIKTLITKTDVRNVIRHRPDLIKHITADTLVDSKLTCKEWILLCDSVISCSKGFDNWDFPDDVKEAFRYDAMAEVLSGKSKLSKRFQNAIKSTTKDNEGGGLTAT